MVHGGAWWCMVHGAWCMVGGGGGGGGEGGLVCSESEAVSFSRAYRFLTGYRSQRFFFVLFWYLAYTTTAHRITGRPDPDREQDAQHDRLGGAGRTPVPVLAPGAHRAPQTLCVRARATSLRVRNERPQPRRAARCRPRCD